MLSTGIAFGEYRSIVSMLCDFVCVLVQWFGFTPHSPSKTIHCKADFMCQSISTLLKHKYNICMYQRIKATDRKVSKRKGRKEILTCVSASE